MTRMWLAGLAIAAACTTVADDLPAADEGATTAGNTGTTPDDGTAGNTTANDDDATPTSSPDDTAGPGTDPGTTTSEDQTGTGDTGAACVDDACPAPNGGVQWQCRQRFMYGVNYAWLEFGGDFGGIEQWSLQGVAARTEEHLGNLQSMREQAGASTIRWWMFPDFRGDGVTFDAEDQPTGLGGTAIADVQAALELAEQADVYLMLTLFSFDGFRPSADVAGIWTPGLTPIVLEPAQRSMLLENVVRPLAAAVQASPYAHRMIAWDVINEPEWAMTGTNPYGDMPYTPNGELTPVTHAQMEAFVSETVAVLRSESDALITVGAAAFKWAHAWSQVDIDFHQFHMYGWVNDYWPYDQPPSAYDLGDKPVVMGEFPWGELEPGVSHGQVVAAWWDLGYAGALAWDWNGVTPQWAAEAKAFADLHPCETAY